MSEAAIERRLRAAKYVAAKNYKEQQEKDRMERDRESDVLSDSHKDLTPETNNGSMTCK